MLHMEDLLNRMHRIGASDLILTAGTPPQFRIHGVLEPMGSSPLKPEDTHRLTSGQLTKKQMLLLEDRRSLDFSRGYEGLARFRMNAFYQRGAIGLAVRLIPYEIPSFEALGLPEIVKDFSLRSHGLVLVTGPAGMGKSTTLAAMIDFINSRRHVHVVCIEDPIEYTHSHNKSVVEQRQVFEDARSFDEALRSVFRQSPDIIMVGEMRDLETIQLALNLAETGHLIMATLHTHDTTNAINRIVSVFPTHQQQQIYTQLSMTLVGVISQVLVPKADRSGRVLGYEVMTATNAVRNLIREQETQQLYSAIQSGRGDGMITMNETLKELHNRGLVERTTVLQRSPRPKELARMIGAA